MPHTTPSLYLYDASAGSGKTFTLVKEYLKKLFLAEPTDYYKKILAITFTNKAVGEMKNRILQQLISFSSESAIEKPDDMHRMIAKETHQDLKQIHLKSQLILKHLLQDFSGFSVETIDSFNHRIVRAFAKDLKLNNNFEISLDADILLGEAVDRLIAKVGHDSSITHYLLNYSRSQLLEDKSWDIRNQILETAKLLLSENHREPLDKLSHYELKDFDKFSNGLQKAINHNNKEAENLVRKTFSLLETHGIPSNSLSRYYLNFLRKVKKDIQSVDLSKTAKWHTQIEEGSYSFYPKSCPEVYKVKIDLLASELSEVFLHIKRITEINTIYKLILRDLLPMAVINLVAKERNQLQKEQNIVLIGDFNHLLYQQVKDQPAPFIYERLGEKYRHFFVDEFQDTSLLQWENMLPLMDNVISQSFESGLAGSVMLVGDAKQSIYRWRGGNPEQFIQLTRDQLPFHIEPNQKKVVQLETNYRSAENIIKFNNKFFTYIANIIKKPSYKDLYLQGSQQKTNTKKGGYIQIARLPKATGESSIAELYQREVIEILRTLQKRKDISLSDICILVRENKQGILISEALATENIPFISSETLLLRNSQEVNALLNSLRLLLYPTDKKARVKLAYFLYEHLKVEKEKHDFLLEITVPDKLSDFLEVLSHYHIHFDIADITQASLYQTFEILIARLKLDKNASAYLYSFMDFVHTFEQSQTHTQHMFFDYWEIKSKNLSIPLADQPGAVQIMTIHKSKGLEFPIVILPFCNSKLGDLSRTKGWLPWEEGPFEEVYVSINDKLGKYSDMYQQKYEDVHEKEVFDELNNIYVAFTRASEELYILTDKQRNSSKTYLLCDQLQNFVENEGGSLEEDECYIFGDETYNTVLKEQATVHQVIEPEYILTDPQLLQIVTHKADLWNSKIEESLSYGTELHKILEEILTYQDFLLYFENQNLDEDFPLHKKAKLRNIMNHIVTHKDLRHLFDGHDDIRTELEIITADRRIQRIDRLNFHSPHLATLLDYKTGEPSLRDIQQIEAYASALSEIGISLKEKLLVYINGINVVVNKV